jgi:hypothetical protein
VIIQTCAFFQLLIPGLTPFSLLESESGIEIVTQLADTGKLPSSHLGLWFSQHLPNQTFETLQNLETNENWIEN